MGSQGGGGMYGGQRPMEYGGGYGMGNGMMNGGVGNGQMAAYNGMTPWTGTQQLGGYQQQAPWQWNPYQQQQQYGWQGQQQAPFYGINDPKAQQQMSPYNFLNMLMQPRRGLFGQQWSEGNSNYGSPGGMESLARPAVAAPQNFAGSGYEETLAQVKKPVVINYENGGAGM